MQLAVIQEDQCVGCTKCIAACPVDAIVGAQGFMHTILVDECIGCNLCVAPCPMDCIEVITRPEPITAEFKSNLALQAKTRYKNRMKRLQQKALRALPSPEKADNSLNIQVEIEEAILRVKGKKQNKDLGSK